ncbi:hypothetical protein SZ63_10890 [Methanoculleus sediminis]|uniref:Uncharacterized protein n=1 Tax=Methanoculleus sediminis TaxID=1550566 RepID=A0A0H1QXS4_9EURY|nr:hypothetical protein [Methanoculleus sediminis]KLK87386.1 hypothetical protein SZ63_10890 [Methanoculleus sediminis]
MTPGCRPAFLVLLIALLVATPALAHVPLFARNGSSPDAAFVVEDPAKSWVIYDTLPDGPAARYYRFRMEEGERIYATLQVPYAGGFVPGMVLTGPGIGNAGTVPPYVAVPEGSGATAVPGRLPEQPEYEPFTPSKLYELARIDTAAPQAGDYTLVVYTPGEGGNYALALGYVESYTPGEWVRVPIDVAAIHRHEGQPLLLIFAPMIAVLAIGAALLLRRRQSLSPFAVSGAIAGLLFIGSGAMTLMQMVIAAVGTDVGAALLLTLVFAVIPVLLGVWALLVAFRRQIGAGEQIAMAALGALALVAWAGLVIGPVLAFIAAILPARRPPP